MIPILYEATETEFTSNGIGRLVDATYVHVYEERNGQYELEMDYPVTGQYYGELELMRLIVAVPSREATRQPFEIYEISKPFSEVVTVKARHISYRLAKIVVGAFTASSCATALAGLKSHAIGSCPFDFYTDKQTSGAFTVKAPTALRSLLGGQEGSILDVYGAAEYEFDKFLVRLYQHRGTDRGVTIMYGKNLTDMTDESNSGDVYTGIVPYYSKDNTLVVGSAVYGSHRGDYPYDMTIPMDFTNRFESSVPTAAQVTAAGQSYISSSSGWEINTNIRVSFVDLSDTLEYKDVAALQAVNLCDTVTVKHPVLGVEATAKVVKTDYDVLAERYASIELGAVKAGLGQAITAPIEEELKDVPTTSVMESAIAAGTALLSGAVGGHIKIVTDANGKPQQALILSGETEATSRNIWRWNENGIGFSNDYGVTYKQAWTIDGKFFTDWVTASVFDAGIINAGALQSSDGKVSFDLDNAILKIEKATGLQITAGNLQVDSSGNVTITGTIHAASGDVGGWQILSDRLRKVVNPTETTEGYTVELLSPANPSATSAAIRVRTAPATTGDPDWSNVFLVRYNGVATITGQITANSGKIGGTNGLTILNGKGFYSGSKNALMSGKPGIYVGADGFSVGNNGTYRPALWCNYSDEKIRVAELNLVTTPDSSPYWGNGHALLLDDYKRVFSGAGCNFGSNGAANPPSGEYNSVIYNTLWCNNVSPYSDRRVKRDIADISTDDAKSFLMALRPVSFRYKDGALSDSQERHHGMIAQEVREVVKDKWGVVTGREEDVLGLKYTEMIADIVKVVQDQERRISELEARLEGKD